jgi:hypothetical protein
MRDWSRGTVGFAILVSLAGIFLLDAMGAVIKHLSGGYGLPSCRPIAICSG